MRRWTWSRLIGWVELLPAHDRGGGIRPWIWGTNVFVTSRIFPLVHCTSLVYMFVCLVISVQWLICSFWSVVILAVWWWFVASKWRIRTIARFIISLRWLRCDAKRTRFGIEVFRFGIWYRRIRIGMSQVGVIELTHRSLLDFHFHCRLSTTSTMNSAAGTGYARYRTSYSMTGQLTFTCHIVWRLSRWYIFQTIVQIRITAACMERRARFTQSKTVRHQSDKHYVYVFICLSRLDIYRSVCLCQCPFVYTSVCLHFCVSTTLKHKYYKRNVTDTRGTIPLLWLATHC